MKMLNISKSILLATALLLAMGAFAADKGTLRVFEPVMMAGKQLMPGQYKVEWQGNGTAVEVNILHGKSVVARAPARLIELNRAPLGDLMQSTKNPDGSVWLTQMQFRGKKYALEIGDAAQSETASSTK